MIGFIFVAKKYTSIENSFLKKFEEGIFSKINRLNFFGDLGTRRRLLENIFLIAKPSLNDYRRKT